MTTLVQAHVQIRGIRSLLFNCLHHSEEFGKRIERSGNAGNDPIEWQRFVLATPASERHSACLPMCSDVCVMPVATLASAEAHSNSKWTPSCRFSSDVFC